MKDYAESIRQQYIQDYARNAYTEPGGPMALGHPGPAPSLDAKRAAIRQRWHADGKYFVGEESLANRNGGKVFDRFTGWKK